MLNDGPPNVAARLSFGEVGEADRVGDVGAATVTAKVNQLWNTRGFSGVYSPDEVEATQTWSAKCRISISTAQDEHLIVGRRLIRSILATGAEPAGTMSLKGARMC